MNRVIPFTVAVLGLGAWGSTLAELVKAQGHELKPWRRGDHLAEAVQETALILSVVSMSGVSSVIAQLQTVTIPKQAILVSATKGLDAQTCLTPSQLWQAAYPDHPVVVLSGPNLSKEIRKSLPAAAVAASSSMAAAETVQWALSSDRFRIYTSSDPVGVELGGTLKNVMAIAAGVCDGLSLGTNAKAALVTRGLREITRIGVHLGAQAETFSGLSGLGDLLATCNSPLSRNYQVGYKLAQGQTLEEVIADSQGVAEGVNTTQVLVELAKREQIAVPIAQQVYRLLKGEITPQAAVHNLMERALKHE